MNIKRVLAAGMVLSLVVLCGYVFAEETREKLSPKAQAKALVESAEEFFLANGKEKTIEEINKPEGKFIVGDFYVFAYDLKGVVIAHPYRRSLIGKNVLNEADSRGKYFRREIIERAKKQGDGWVEYRYKNPTTRKEKLKTTYFKKVDDMVICCGAY